MILYFLNTFFSDTSVNNIFSYITVRVFCAVLTSLIICLILGPKFINFMSENQKKGQPIRLDGPQSHLLTKKGTPTMGGILILLSLVISSLIWSDLGNNFVWITIFRFMLGGFIKH